MVSFRTFFLYSLTFLSYSLLTFSYDLIACIISTFLFRGFQQILVSVIDFIYIYHCVFSVNLLLFIRPIQLPLFLSQLSKIIYMKRITKGLK